MTYPSSSAPRVLLVEGQDDKHMIWQLCKRDPSFSVSREGAEGYEMWVKIRNQRTKFEITEKGSRKSLLDSIWVEVNASGMQTVGIIMDADSDVRNSWKDIITGFSGTDIKLPASPATTGTIVNPGVSPSGVPLPRIGVWLMPDNESKGELEDLAFSMVPSNDDTWKLAQNYIDGIPSPERKFQPDKIDKAKLYAWLATRKEPSRMGAAIGAAGGLDASIPVCKDLLAWLSDLFR